MKSDFKARTITSRRSDNYGKKCAMDCGRPMLVGDTVIIMDAGRGVYVGRETLIHRECLLRWLLTTPMSRGAVAQEIERIRIDGSAVMELLGV